MRRSFSRASRRCAAAASALLTLSLPNGARVEEPGAAKAMESAFIFFLRRKLALFNAPGSPCRGHQRYCTGTFRRPTPSDSCATQVAMLPSAIYVDE
jgi:hypothetical protein